jgi:putative transposase
MAAKRYPTDMTDAQWEMIRPLVEQKKKTAGRPRTVDLRRIVDGIFYILRTGCQYRMLPHDFPPWETVYYYAAKWRKDGTLDRLHDALREQVRDKERPSARRTASVDSQSTDSAGAQQDRAFDGGKKLEGRKRHLIVDSLGLLLAVVLTAGNVSDAKGGMACLDQMDPQQYPNLETIFADKAYTKEGFPDKVEQWKPGCQLNVISRPADAEGFVKLPIRWVVERTNAWLTKNRRLCRSYEHTTSMETAYVKLAMISRMTRRLSPSPAQSPYRYTRKVK